MSVIGWDIGGVNTKVARVSAGVLVAAARAYELQRAPAQLVSVLSGLAADVGAAAGDVHAVTMTAELSQMFRTKREGVRFVLDAVRTAFNGSDVHVFAVDGSFVSVTAAFDAPLTVAAANWSATAHAVATHHPDALLIDVGTTTTDVIPVAGGRVAASGLTDPDRLASGELVYTGALRTPVEAIVSHVPLAKDIAGVSAEGFAIAGDIHLWRGDLAPADYTVPTPDGRPATREFAGERIARVVCGDREMLDAPALDLIAASVAHAQVVRIRKAIGRVLERHQSISTAVVTGLGTFIGVEAARMAGLATVPLAAELGDEAAKCAPAASVALLLEAQLRGDRPAAGTTIDHRAHRIDRDHDHRAPIVVKIGGGVLAHRSLFGGVLTVIGCAGAPLVIVPGGGPFADAVRAADARLGVSDEAAHWMAILAMDQYAHLIASRLTRSVIVDDQDGIDRALRTARIPVLAPFRWLRAADPLPHSWDVTSDSIAAWIAGTLGSSRLVLVKPPNATGPALTDRYFPRALSGTVEVSCIAADALKTLAWTLLATERAAPSST